MYLRVILKSWVPKDGAASRAWRHATLYPNMLVKRAATWSSTWIAQGWFQWTQKYKQQ